MIIDIPNDDFEDIETPVLIGDRSTWVRWFFDCANWLCPKCGGNNFGRNRRCPACLNKGTETNRPTDYLENTYDGKDNQSSF